MIALKKLKIHKDMSEETTAFTAEVHFNDALVAYANNTGKGGCAQVIPADRGDSISRGIIRNGLAEAVAWVKAQPVRGEEGKLHTSLPDYLDEVVFVESLRRDRASFIRKQVRAAARRGRIVGYRQEGCDLVCITFPDSPEGRHALNLTRPALLDLGGLTPAEAAQKVDEVCAI